MKVIGQCQRCWERLVGEENGCVYCEGCSYRRGPNWGWILSELRDERPTSTHHAEACEQAAAIIEDFQKVVKNLSYHRTTLDNNLVEEVIQIAKSYEWHDGGHN